MPPLEEKVREEMIASFSDLCAIHMPSILKRAYQFTLDDEELLVTFKFAISNAGKVVRVEPTMSMPGQKLTDGSAMKVIDLDQPELLAKKRKE